MKARNNTLLMLAMKSIGMPLVIAVSMAVTGTVNAVTVNYTMQTGNFNSLQTERNNNPPYSGTYNNGATEIGQYANTGSFGNTPGAAAFQTFTTTGNGTSGSARALQVGDTFTITGFTSANPSAGGRIGIAFRDSTTYTNFASSIDSTTEARFQLDNTGGWKVYNSGTAVDSSLGSNVDRTFTIKITSDTTFDATIGGNTYYNLGMAAGGGTIDSFALYTFGDSNQNSFWKSASLSDTGTVELGYAATGTITPGLVSDGLAANSTTTTRANAVFIGGAAGSQVNLTQNNTYTGATTINALATAEAQHANALGTTGAGTTVTNTGTLKLFGGVSYATEALTLNGLGRAYGDVAGDAGALRSNGGNNTWNGNITLGSSSRINSDTAGGAGSLTIAGNITGGSNVLYLGTKVGSSSNISISGAISGAGALEAGTTTSVFKDGANTLTLSGNNSYSGATLVTAGTLALSGNGTLGSGSVSVTGGTLDLGGKSVTNALSLTSGTVSNGTITNNGSNFDLQSGTVGAALAGTNGVNKTTAGTLYLSGSNSYSGNTTIGGNSILEAWHANALGSTAAGTSVTNGSALNLYSASGISYASEALTLNGLGVAGINGALRSTGGNNTWNGNITLGASSRISTDTTGAAGSLTIAGNVAGGSNVLFLGANGANIAISGAISGAGAAQDGTTTSLFKDGANTLSLSGNNTYSGDTRITNGAVTVAAGGTLGDGSSDVFISSAGSLNVNTNTTVASVQETGTGNGGAIAIGSGAILTVNGTDKGTLFQNSISGLGGLTVNGSGTTALSLYGTQSYSGATRVSGAKISTAVAMATSGVTIDGGTFETTAADILGNSASVNLSSGTYALGGNDTIGSLTMSGGSLTGISTLTATTYALSGGTVGANLGAGAATAATGTTALNGTLGGSLTVSGGTVNLGGADRISNSSAVSVSSGTLGLGVNNDTVASFAISGGSLTGSGTLTAATYALNGGTVSANLGAGNLSVGGNSTLNGTSAATTVSVSTGTLSLGGSNRLATGASVSLAAGAGLNLGANSQQLAGLTGDGTVTTSASGSLNLNIASGSNTFAGGIGGAGGLTKSGNGTLFLSGSNALTGTTAVSAGTLRVNGSVGGDATVASGATLGGTGTISGAVNVTGVLSPGASIESLAVGSTSFNTGSTFEWEFNSSNLTADLLDVTGALNLTGTVGLNLIDLASSSLAITEGTKFSLISYTGSWNSGTFSGYADDSVFKIGVNDWRINYNDITGGSNFASEQSGAAGFVTMTVVPEPSAAALALLAGGLLATRRRRTA